MRPTLTLYSMFIAMFFSVSTFAAGTDDSYGVEIRISTGAWSKPSDMNNQLTNAISVWPTQPQPQVLAADFIYDVEAFLIGLRFESVSGSSSTSSSSYLLPNNDVATNISTKLNADRLSAILGYRYDLDTWAYVDGLVTVGLLQHASFKSSYHDTTSNSDVSGTDTATLGTSWSLGVDGAVKFSYFEIGAEFGYLSFKATKFADSSGNTFAVQNTTITADLSGLYYKAFIGVLF